MIGGSGEKRTLRLVAQYADMCNVSRRARDDRATSSTCCATHCKDVGRDPSEITTTRLGTLMLTERRRRDRAARPSSLRGLAGAEFDEQFTVGEPDEVVRKVGTLVDAGLDGLIFNMPLSEPDDGRRAPASCSPRRSPRLRRVPRDASRNDSATRPTRGC